MFHFLSCLVGTAAQIGNFWQWCMGRILPLQNSSAYGAIVVERNIHTLLLPSEIVYSF